MKDTTLQYHSSLDEICFPVDKRPVADLFPDYDFADDLTHAVYRTDETATKILQLCPDSYELIPNEKLLAPLVEGLDHRFGSEGYEALIRSYDDRRFYLSFTIKEEYSIAKKDKLRPRIEIRNSYDGSMRQTVSLSFYRLICSNGMMGMSEVIASSTKHRTGAQLPDYELVFDELEDISYRVERFKRMTDRRVTPDELEEITEIIRKRKQLKYPAILVDQAPIIAEKEAAQLGVPLNSWLVYNGFNHALYHSRGKLLPDERERIDRNVLRTMQQHWKLPSNIQ
ncbi:DUF932 domain-containing protein [Tunicatimonas pelagia]|uniref:DUF932 domain-containing protein n=1 Tax=Tunicatimonas pelagia TaxID=931531 RepID=UPI002664E9AC|nr:DUF932 domain-containing protein [Tunicatimonas pelagia]WKN46410.1 DUF932 domain-containing protein [Tunicatimonas pelagia]